MTALARAGFVDAREEAETLIEAARGDTDLLHGWLRRRLQGEPLPWLTGTSTFMGDVVCVDRGVYVPRPRPRSSLAGPSNDCRRAVWPPIWSPAQARWPSLCAPPDLPPGS